MDSFPETHNDPNNQTAVHDTSPSCCLLICFIRVVQAPPVLLDHKALLDQRYFSILENICVLLTSNATQNPGIPVALKGDLLWYSFRRTSAFCVPS